MNISFLAPTHRNTILNAMQTLAYAVGTPVRGQTTRRPCISFRSKQIQDSAYLKIIYGDGCSGTVRNHIRVRNCADP